MPLQQRLFLLSCDSRLQLCSFSETSRFQKIYLQRPAVTFQDDMQYANVPILFKESSPTPTLKGIKIELPEISDCFPPIKSHLCTRRWVEGRRTKVVATEMTYFNPTILQKNKYPFGDLISQARDYSASNSFSIFEWKKLQVRRKYVFPILIILLIFTYSKDLKKRCSSELNFSQPNMLKSAQDVV